MDVGDASTPGDFNLNSLMRFDVATAVTLVGVVLGYLVWRSWNTRGRKIVHGSADSPLLPTPTPVLPRWLGFVGGHTLQLDQEKLVEQLEAWADDFGGDYELHMFGKRTVIVTGVADIRRILALRPSKFKRGLSSSQFTWAAGKVGFLSSMFFDEGKVWGRSRRLISPPLNGHNVVAMIPVVSKIGERFCAKMGERADTGEPVDAIEELERFTHDVIALAAFGLDADSVRATQDRPCPSFDAMASIMSSLLALIMNPLAMLGWVSLSSMLPWVRRTKENSAVLTGVIQSAIDKVRSETQKENRATETATGTNDDDEKNVSAGSFLRKVVSATGGRTKAKGFGDRMTFSDEEVVLQVKSLFLAGTETTALTLSWTMYFLAKHPEMVARCREEALRVAPLSNGMVSTNEQLAQLVFCSAIFKETLRLRGAGTFLFLHAVEPTTLKSGVELNEGAALTLLTRHASLSEDAFTRPKDFVPERWIDAERKEALLGDSAGHSTADVRHDEQAYLAFGGGPRICPGQDMAKTEASVIIAAICARFDVGLAPGQADPPEEVLMFTSGPRAVKLVFSRRAA